MKMSKMDKFRKGSMKVCCAMSLSVRMGTGKALVAKRQGNVQNEQVYKRSHEGGFDHVHIGQDGDRKCLGGQMTSCSKWTIFK